MVARRPPRSTCALLTRAATTGRSTRAMRSVLPWSRPRGRPVTFTQHKRRLAMDMTGESNCVAVFEQHDQAEQAIRKLQHGGFDMKKLSIIGRDYHTEEHAVGFYNAGDH